MIIIHISINMFLDGYCISYPYIFQCVYYFSVEIHLKESMTLSLFTCARLPSSSKESAYICPPNKVLGADYDTHFNYFFSATTEELIYAVLVIVEPPYLQQRANSLRGGPHRPTSI